MKASDIVDELFKYKYTHFTGVPCSIVKPLINYVIDSKDCNYVPATIEGEAASIASGAYLAGINYVVFMQNSGLGNIINPLTSLLQLYRTPCLFFVTWRGEPGKKDALQHEMMGETVLELLKALKQPFEVMKDSAHSLSKIVKKANEHVQNYKQSFFIILPKGIIESYELQSKIQYQRDISFETMSLGSLSSSSNPPSRGDVLECISKETKEFPVISSTGYNSREFFNVEDRPSNFYMQGSMGFTLPFSLGLSLHYAKKVFCIDGDGSCLMRTSGLLTAGAFNKGNLVYILLDNMAHESTGGQATISTNVKYDKLAEAAGFNRFITVNDISYLSEAISLAKGGSSLSFLHVKTRLGPGQNLKRPTMTLPEITNRFKDFVHKKNL